MSDEPRTPPVHVPHGALSPEALRGVVEAVVLREGTDYGERETAHEDKVRQVVARLERGEARIVYDPDSDLFWSYHLFDTPDDNNVLTYDLDTGMTTAIGASHTADEFGGGNVNSMVFVTHSCPM